MIIVYDSFHFALFNSFDIFIEIGYDDGECLLMEFLKRGGKVHFRALIPLNNKQFTVI